MTIELITDHDARAIARLLTEYKDSANLQAMISSGVAQVQELENVFFDMLTSRSFAEGEGEQLDGIGRIVGVARTLGANDAAYRVQIVGQIAKNTGFGTPEDVISVLRILTGATSVRFMELFPASVAIELDVGVPVALAGAMAEVAQTLLPAGVSLSYISSAPADEGGEYFAYAGGIDGLGFGDATDPDIGGRYASLLGSIDEGDEDEMATKNVAVSFTAESTKDVDTYVYGMNAQKCLVETLDSADSFRTMGIEVSRPDINTIRLTSGVAITKTFRILIVETKD